MNVRSFSLLTLLLFCSSTKQMQQEQVGVVNKVVQSAKQLTKYVPSMQEVSNAVSKAKNTIVSTIKDNPYISATIGVSVVLLTGAYIYFKGRRKCSIGPRCTKHYPAKEVPVTTQNAKPVESPASNPKAEFVEAANDSDQSLLIKVLVPARTHALIQLIKNIEK